MSRCFPFPPPGYEKARNEDANLPMKEKHKEKRHKKEKDREKKEGKEKKDKDRSKDKHKEKKDRKERHKDKKDKDKNKTSDEKRNEGRKEGCNGLLGEFGYKAETLKDSKLMGELGRRIRDEATGNGCQLAQNFSVTADQRRNEGFGRLMGQTEKKTEGKDKKKDENKHGDFTTAEKQSDKDKYRGTSDKMVRNINDTDQKRIVGSIPTEKEAEKRIEGKEKVNKGKEIDRRGERHNKNGELEEKRSKGNEKYRDKEKKEEKDKLEQDNHKYDKEQHKFRENGRMEQTGKTLNIKSSFPPKDSNNSVSLEGNLKKRKELETNGFIHENVTRPNKLPRPASYLLPSENGWKSESCHVTISSTSDRKGSNDIRKVEINKEHSVNGIAETQPSSVVPRPSISIEASENGEASTRPPHPDSKYLNQILSIPKVGEWSDFDDQEWLFGSNSLGSKPKAAVCNSSEIPQVWAEALQLESADVCALPYVIPY
eukprot:TRINITY_DN37449_c0_g2_i3.p1 TRINITY_DN37449_c0_g2~~TRINITY_DN37449_c0_g2_i3.p1  ORF type:complete len:485 (+),score=133.82 TRINITY_DN37449_c0_g2_i3:536-1990(+)